MEFIDEKLDEYVCAHTSVESDLLYTLNRETHLKILQPRMLSGHFQGRVLSMFSKMIQPKRILELGTYTGYSALCLLEGLHEDGELITIDCNEELEEFAASHFAKQERKSAIVQIVGDAMEIIPTLVGKFDLIFIDADKANYLNYYHLLIDRIPSGGYLLADNVLWSGKVIEEQSNNDKDTNAIKEFNLVVQNDERVENVLFPIRDGLLMVRKK
jgi:predicted O-methyltransferase YrrM